MTLMKSRPHSRPRTAEPVPLLCHPRGQREACTPTPAGRDGLAGVDGRCDEAAAMNSLIASSSDLLSSKILEFVITSYAESADQGGITYFIDLVLRLSSSSTSLEVNSDWSDPEGHGIKRTASRPAATSNERMVIILIKIAAPFRGFSFAFDIIAIHCS